MEQPDFLPLFAPAKGSPGYGLASTLRASQKANNISATPFFASIEESGPEPDDRRARQSAARFMGVAIGQREQIGCLKGRY
jgi:hypothetical protein